ncbi:hypothetical protein PoB_001669400 [Plakobranchus ocellatus]|uniref:Uncharacterized protein n=1 Tax=Plakobranchus ocellatus TaxID=259542 RepID=A0AAV3Z8D6_9GAST|nr:hypothetical protein PoB_001669400 [Plakobranchus ocellatus]
MTRSTGRSSTWHPRANCGTDSKSSWMPMQLVPNARSSTKTSAPGVGKILNHEKSGQGQPRGHFLKRRVCFLLLNLMHCYSIIKYGTSRTNKQL